MCARVLVCACMCVCVCVVCIVCALCVCCVCALCALCVRCVCAIACAQREEGYPARFEVVHAALCWVGEDRIGLGDRLVELRSINQVSMQPIL